MAKCINHPGRLSARKLGGADYCEQCVKGIETAGGKVHEHVEPKECFVWYKGTKEGWQPITGTGCAHWVAHEKGIRKGRNRCLLGYTGRVKELVAGMSAIKDLTKVKKGDLWFADDLSHCGVVVAVKPAKSGDPAITIRHDSTKLNKVATSDWATYFKRAGKFYK